MGFNVSIHRRIPSPLDESWECDQFIDRRYYSFTTSYQLFGEESVLVKVGEYFGLDTRPLGLHIHYESEDEDYLNSGWLDLTSILTTVETLKSSIEQNPDFAENLIFTCKDNINQRQYFLEYLQGEKVLEDLAIVIDILKCLKAKRAKKIFFGVG